MGRMAYLTPCGRWWYGIHMNHSTYTHPSEGKSLPVRFLIALVAVGFLLLICSAPKAEGARRIKFGAPCRIVASDADHDDGRIDRIAARHGGVDYRGAKYGPGVWTTNDTGKVFGYSIEEDSIVYASARCAKTRPLYVR